MGLRDLGFLKASLASKDQGKELIQYCSLFHVLCHQVHCLIEQRAHIFPSLSVVTYVLTEALVAFDALGQIQSIRALAFLTLSQDAQTIFLYSSQVTLLASTLFMLLFCV